MANIRFLRDVVGFYDVVYKAGYTRECTIQKYRNTDQLWLVEGHGYGTPVTLGVDIEYVDNEPTGAKARRAKRRQLKKAW